MSTIRCIYHNGPPNFPATDQHPDAVRYTVGPYVVDAVGEPTLAEVEVALGLDAASLAEAARKSSIESAIASDTTVASLKAMTNAEFDTWWAANVTNAAQAINVLKRVTRVVIRRVL
jgi:hypothetical protein